MPQQQSVPSSSLSGPAGTPQRFGGPQRPGMMSGPPTGPSAGPPSSQPGHFMRPPASSQMGAPVSSQIGAPISSQMNTRMNQPFPASSQNVSKQFCMLRLLLYIYFLIGGQLCPVTNKCSSS